MPVRVLCAGVGLLNVCVCVCGRRVVGADRVLHRFGMHRIQESINFPTGESFHGNS